MVSCTLPPYLSCGIGYYAGRLATTLAEVSDVRVLTGQKGYHDLPGVRIERCFSRESPRSIRAIAGHVEADVPDWIVIQYAPDTLVHRGITPLPGVIRRIRRKHPSVRVATMVHECLKPVDSLKSAIQYPLLWRQLRALGRNSELVLFSIEAWMGKFRPCFPSTTQVRLMPVGSNIERVSCDRTAVRAELGIGTDNFVLGLFGRVGPTSDLAWVKRAAGALANAGLKPVILHIGTWGPQVVSALAGLCPVIHGAVSAEEVSRRFQAMDLYLLPDHEGASLRRARLMTSLSHGVPVLATKGPITGHLLLDQADKSLVLTPAGDLESFVRETVRIAQDARVRARMGRQAEQFFASQFSWPHLSQLWKQNLGLAD